MIDVRLYAALVRTPGPGPCEFEVEPRFGLTVGDVVAEAGIHEDDVAVGMINGQSASLDSALSEGDRVGLFSVVSGG